MRARGGVGVSRYHLSGGLRRRKSINRDVESVGDSVADDAAEVGAPRARGTRVGFGLTALSLERDPGPFWFGLEPPKALGVAIDHAAILDEDGEQARPLQHANIRERIGVPD